MAARRPAGRRRPAPPSEMARRPSATRAVPRAAAQAVAAEVKRRLVFDLGGQRPRRFEVIPVGSVRRRAPHVKDIDLLVVVPAGALAPADFDRALGAAALRPPRGGDAVSFADTSAAGPRRRSLILRAEGRGRGGKAQNYRTDLFIATAAEKPYALYHFTGSREYNVRTRAHAKRSGWLLNQYGLFDAATGRRVRGAAAIRTERDLARFLGVTYRPPRARGAATLARPGR
jgi:DNA polymerase (family 10)